MDIRTAAFAAASLAWREIIRFFRQRNRIVGSIGTPLVFKSSSRDPFRPSLEYANPKSSGGMLIDMGIHDFDLARVSRMKPDRLLRNAGIIRNRLKIDAAIENARRILALRKSHGSFAAWLDAHHPRGKEEWVKLFRRTFLFTGGEITGSFLMSTGYLPGAHDQSCPVFRKIARLRPPWMS